MAKQTGLFKVKGTLDNVTFYKSKDGHLAKMKTSLDGSRISSDPAFARTRENGSEFGFSAKSGKLMRNAMRSFIMSSSDNRLVSRVTKIMIEIKNYDTVSVRGKRSVGIGINTPAAVALLVGLEFNIHALLSGVLFKPYALDLGTGVISMPGLVPINDIVYPKGATHFSLTAAKVNIDFANEGASKLVVTNTINLPLDGMSTDVVLTPMAPSSGTGKDFYLLKIEFFQMVNGVQYTLKNGAYNAVSIIAVS